MTINDEISIIANQIANKGNKPTVALIKAKLKTRVPLPVIISVLKTWQHEPSFISLPTEQKSMASNEKKTSSADLTSLEDLLHHELSDMKEEIRELKALVQGVINQQKK